MYSIVWAQCSIPAFAQPVLISNGVGPEFSSSTLVAEGALKKKLDREPEVGLCGWARAGGLLLVAVWAKTVTSSFPLRPYVGDQMSSSISRTSEIANKDGASAVVSRVFVTTASGYEKVN